MKYKTCVYAICKNEEKFIKSPFIKNAKIYNTNDLAYYKKDGEILNYEEYL